MKVHKGLLSAILLLSTVSATAQVNKEKILYKWDLVKFDLLADKGDTTGVAKELADIVFTFSEDSVAIARKQPDGSELMLKTAPYRISADGTELFLSNDPGTIIMLDDAQLHVRVENEVMLYFRKRGSTR